MRKKPLSGSRRLVALNIPEPVQIQAGAFGTPLQVRLERGVVSVSEIQESWRIDDEWWRKPIARFYHRVVLEDGRIITVYHDEVAGSWFLQR